MEEIPMHQEVEEPQVTNSGICFIRLNRGDDIIAEVLADANGFFTLINPYMVLYMVNPKVGTMSVQLNPWVFSRLVDTNEFMVASDDVLTLAPASQSLMNYYRLSVDQFVEMQQVTKDKVMAIPLDDDENERDDEDSEDSLINQADKRWIH